MGGVGMLEAVSEALRGSLAEVPPSASELQIALRRATLNALSTHTHGAWSTDCFADASEQCGELRGLDGGLIENLIQNTHLYYGPYVQALAFFDDKVDQEHLALVRCQTVTADSCWMEFHMYQDRLAND